MSLTFYCLSGSPFSWKVWLALEHVGATYALRILSADAGEHKATAYLAVNPRGKVPAIVHGGFSLWESAPIVEYLAERFPDRRLWPEDAHPRATARRLAAEADCYVYPPLRRLVVELLLRKDGAVDMAIVAESKATLAEELAIVETQLSGGFLCGASVCAADFAFYPLTAILLRVSARAPHLGLGDLLGPRMRDWRKRIEALPYFATTIPPHWRTT